ncbi:putative ribosomal N-acetyltransferase YdaF [bioreactor metagenome]|uniref:Putative ribosomal N-acetyltransferase YdaF n=1 Tax=bioreactor metagenome TaxID=1076179 RepID=A0A644TIA6_9ZZZZ
MICIEENLYLRELCRQDAQEIFDAIDTNRPYFEEWLPFVPFTKSVDDSLEYINSVIDAKELVYTIREGKTFFGIIGFKETNIDTKTTELGYWLKEEYQGKGIITKAAKILCDNAFKEREIKRIIIKVEVGNNKSKAIPERLDFVLQGIEKDTFCYNKTLNSYVFYKDNN